jgi:hypothetical protein
MCQIFASINRCDTAQLVICCQHNAHGIGEINFLAEPRSVTPGTELTKRNSHIAKSQRSITVLESL